MPQFHQATVKELKRLTPSSVEVTLNGSIDPKEFDFLAGQYLTFLFNHQGEELRRCYSICSSPAEAELSVAVKALENGRISTYFNSEMKVGDKVRIMTPEGNFTIPERKGNTHYVFFAAGSGITPIMSMIRSLLETSESNLISLFFGNRSAEETMFKAELDKLASENENFKVYHILTDGSTGVPMFSGRINFGKTSELLYNFCADELLKEYFICGPTGMMQSVQNALTDRGISDENIHLEYFETPDLTPKNESVPAAEEEEAFEGTARVKIILDDEEFDYDLNTKGATILNSVLDEGADAPYSCKGGVCTSCKAKVLKGSVKMDNDFTLTDSEKEEGFILTCQSHPTSKEVIISYDE